jgi:hypothetical protein
LQVGQAGVAGSRKEPPGTVNKPRVGFDADSRPAGTRIRRPGLAGDLLKDRSDLTIWSYDHGKGHQRADDSLLHEQEFVVREP